MARYMLAAETFIPPTQTQIAQGAAFIAADHGTSGPVNVSFPVCLSISFDLGDYNHSEFDVIDTNANSRCTSSI